jgi:hypothetical protein
VRWTEQIIALLKEIEAGAEHDAAAVGDDV